MDSQSDSQICNSMPPSLFTYGHNDDLKNKQIIFVTPFYLSHKNCQDYVTVYKMQFIDVFSHKLWKKFQQVSLT